MTDKPFQAYLVGFKGYRGRLNLGEMRSFPDIEGLAWWWKWHGSQAQSSFFVYQVSEESDPKLISDVESYLDSQQ